MAILEENFNESQLALIKSGVQENIFLTEFDEERGDYVRVNVFDGDERYVGTLTSNKAKANKDENLDPTFEVSEPQVQLYRDAMTKKIFIKPNEIFAYMQLDEGNYIIKCDFLRNTIIEIQGCTDNRSYLDEPTAPSWDGFTDVYGNASCGALANEMCLAQNYDPNAGADDGDCIYRTNPGIEPGPDQPGVPG